MATNLTFLKDNSKELSARDGIDISKLGEKQIITFTGCHMAQQIEKYYGVDALGDLVEQGSEAFFNAYSELPSD